jgi:hypothetical protein
VESVSSQQKTGQFSVAGFVQFGQEDTENNMATKAMSTGLSSCCKWEMEVVGSSEGTMHYECCKCGKPCDIWSECSTTYEKSKTISVSFGLKSRIIEIIRLILFGDIQITLPDDIADLIVKKYDHD